MLWLKKKKKKPSALLRNPKWRCGYDACALRPQLSSPVHKRRHQQGSGLPMRLDFHNSHIVTTRCEDYCPVSASHNFQQGNGRSTFTCFLGCFMVGKIFLNNKIRIYRRLIQNKLRVVSEQLLFLGQLHGRLLWSTWCVVCHRINISSRWPK